MRKLSANDNYYYDVMKYYMCMCMRNNSMVQHHVCAVYIHCVVYLMFTKFARVSPTT